MMEALLAIMWWWKQLPPPLYSLFRHRIRRDIPLSQLHNLTNPGFLRIHPEEYHHGIWSTINHDPAFAGLFKLFLFVHYIIHSHCPFITVPGGTEPDREKEDETPAVNETVNEGANTQFFR